MKRVRILTFHRVPNYGAALQAFALKTYIKEKIGNADVAVLDYTCPGNDEFFCRSYI